MADCQRLDFRDFPHPLCCLETVVVVDWLPVEVLKEFQLPVRIFKNSHGVMEPGLISEVVILTCQSLGFVWSLQREVRVRSYGACQEVSFSLDEVGVVPKS